MQRYRATKGEKFITCHKSSASRKQIQSDVDARIPIFREAAIIPLLEKLITFRLICVRDSRYSRVPSVEQLSITITSEGGKD